MFVLDTGTPQYRHTIVLVMRYDVKGFADVKICSRLVSGSKLEFRFLCNNIGRKVTIEAGNGVALHLLKIDLTLIL